METLIVIIAAASLLYFLLRKRGVPTQPSPSRSVQKQKLSALQDGFETYINILEFCPWPDIELAISELQKLGDARAIPYIQPYLNCPEPNAYRAALVALENLGDKSILDHILSVISGKTDRLPILISFLNYSSFRKHEEVISALAALLNQKEHASLLIPFLENTSLCKHPKVVPVLIDLLRNKDIDLNEKTFDLRKNIIDLLGKTENKQALNPLYAHAHTSSVDLRNLALLSIIELNFDESITFLYHYLKNIRLIRENNLLIGVKICEFIVSSERERTKEIDDTIESFCKLFEQNISQFQNIAQEIRSRLQKVMDKIGRKYPKSGLGFIAAAAYRLYRKIIENLLHKA